MQQVVLRAVRKDSDQAVKVLETWNLLEGKSQ